MVSIVILSDKICLHNVDDIEMKCIKCGKLTCDIRAEPTNPVIKGLRDQTYQDFEIIVATEPGIVTAMNCALARAKGEIFVRIDDDVELPPTWLEELVKPFSDPMVAGVTGPTFVHRSQRENRDSIGFIDRHWSNWFLRWLFDFDVFAPAKIYKCGSVSYGSNFINRMLMWRDYKIDHLEGTNWAMRTDLIRKVGGFDPVFEGVAEWFDTDVEQKILKLGGYKLAYNPKAYLWHLLTKGEHYNERFDGLSRIINWLIYHRRHSKFHYKKIIWLMMMCGYFLLKGGERLVRKV